MAEYTHVGPGLPPLHGVQANALILGSFPSPKSREQGFFYGHPQNRFWPMLAAVTGEPVPDWADLEAKKRIILRHCHPEARPGGVGYHRCLRHTRGVRCVHPQRGAERCGGADPAAGGAGGLLQRCGIRPYLRQICRASDPPARCGAAQHQPRQRRLVPCAPAGGLGRGAGTVFARGWLQVNGFCSIMNLCQTPAGADMESAPTE